MSEKEVETAIEIPLSETKNDTFNMSEKEVETAIEIPLSETKNDTFDYRDGIEEHRHSISAIFVPQYIDDASTYNEEYGLDDYVVTYSREDKSVLRWSINTEKNGYQPDVYFKIDQIIERVNDYGYILSKKILKLYNKGVNDDGVWLIDLNSDRTSSDRFLKIKQFTFDRNATGLLPNGDLIHVSVIERKIYKYCFTDKPKNTDPWKCSQIIDIKIPESLFVQYYLTVYYRTKLFLIFKMRKMLQFDLLTMNLERQYHISTYLGIPFIANKNQTLLATGTGFMCSMENGMLISYIIECDNLFADASPVKFITLKDNSERLVFGSDKYNKYKLVDPYQVYDEIDISDDFNNTSVITQLNKKIFINNGNVCVTNGIDENKLQQLSSKNIYINSIYTLSILKVIQNMLKEFIDQVDIKKVENIVLKDEVEIKNLGLCKIVLYNENYVRIEKNDGHHKTLPIPHIFSFKLLNNQNLVLIHMKGISIYTISENGFRQRYFWRNNKWGGIYLKFGKDCHDKYDTDFVNTHYKPLIERILKNEFDDSKHSIPIPSENWSKEIIEDVINDDLVSLKFGIEMLKIAIEKKRDNDIRQIIESTQDYSVNHMTIISLNLPELCDNYPDFIIKYISCTSIILLPYCIDIRNSNNTSLHSYTEIYIKESSMDNNIFKFISELYNGLIRYLRIKEEIQTVSFIVPFPQICVYQDNSENNDHENENEIHEAKKNHDNKSKMITLLKNIITGLKIIMMIPKSNSIWNKFLYKPKSILFCNIDSNHFYNWWNFAAIIDFKWKTFGKLYYFLIWLFYTIFYVCYALASTLEQNSISEFWFKLLFMISIIFGSIFLIFEIRHCLWNYKCYLKDIWNLFDVGAYLLPVIASIFWLINKSQQPWLTAISIILLSFKFLLFFRVFKSYGIYFAIIIGVAKKVFPFLVLLFFIVLGYAQAFFIVLRSNDINDDNNPQNLATKYDFVNSDGTTSNTTTIIQEPDSNTNLFNWFPTSLLAVYNLLTGDSGSLSSFTYREHSVMTILLVTFTFFTVIYLMNLFIGLLNLAIDDYNKEEEFLLQKAQIIMEIELFYLLPWQRNNKEWFPDWIYYDMPVTEIRNLINAIDNGQTVFNYPPIISERLRELVVLTDDNNKLEKKIDRIMNYIGIEQDNKLEKQIEQTKKELEQQIKEELTQQNIELKQQMERIMKYIGVEQDNEKKDNKLEEQIKQTKDELPKQSIGLKQQMDKLNQQMESIMELLLKRSENL